MMWHRIRSLIVKELLASCATRKGRFILIVPPLMQLLVFAFAATQEVKNVHMAVLNQDLGTAVARPDRPLRGFAEFRRGRAPARTRPRSPPAIDCPARAVVLQIGADFSRELAAGRPASVQLMLDGRRVERGADRRRLRAGDRRRLQPRAVRGTALPPPPSSIAARVWFNPNLETTWNTVPGLVAILTTLLGLVVTALSVARERELGTFEQLLVSPLEPIEI